MLESHCCLLLNLQRRCSTALLTHTGPWIMQCRRKSQNDNTLCRIESLSIWQSRRVMRHFAPRRFEANQDPFAGPPWNDWLHMFSSRRLGTGFAGMTSRDERPMVCDLTCSPIRLSAPPLRQQAPSQSHMDKTAVGSKHNMSLFPLAAAVSTAPASH